MVDLDGSMGEGGGQVLRTALSLSILSQQPVVISNIRARRPKPGLMAQHLKSVLAAESICGARVEGAVLNSTDLSFQPGPVKPGRYWFKIGTAGATGLVLQTIFLSLSRAPAASSLVITGGTHVPWSPVYHYLEWQWLPLMKQIGFSANLELLKAGFYPQGGGEIRAAIRPASAISPLSLIQRGNLIRIRGLSGVANLDSEIARRQKLQLLRRLEPVCRDTKI